MKKLILIIVVLLLVLFSNGCTSCEADNVTIGNLHIDHLIWSCLGKDVIINFDTFSMSSTPQEVTAVVPPYVYLKTENEDKGE